MVCLAPPPPGSSGMSAFAPAPGPPPPGKGPAFFRSVTNHPSSSPCSSSPQSSLDPSTSILLHHLLWNLTNKQTVPGCPSLFFPLLRIPSFLSPKLYLLLHSNFFLQFSCFAVLFSPDSKSSFHVFPVNWLLFRPLPCRGQNRGVLQFN